MKSMSIILRIFATWAQLGVTGEHEQAGLLGVFVRWLSDESYPPKGERGDSTLDFTGGRSHVSPIFTPRPILDLFNEL